MCLSLMCLLGSYFFLSHILQTLISFPSESVEVHRSLTPVLLQTGQVPLQPFSNFILLPLKFFAIKNPPSYACLTYIYAPTSLLEPKYIARLIN